MKRIDAIRKRVEAATPGLWISDKRVGCVAVYAGKQMNCLDGVADECILFKMGERDGSTWKTDAQDENNNDFIAHSRSDIPWMLELLEEAKKIIKAFTDGPLYEEDALKAYVLGKDWLAKHREDAGEGGEDKS